MGERATIDQDYLYDIADAIREKKGVTTRFIPAEMKPAILSIGSDVDVEPLNVVANGTYTAPSGKAYSPVTALVPNTYASGDEGKVVQNGALVAQTSRTLTENGTYDTTTNDIVTVDVSGGGGVSRKTQSEWDALSFSEKQALGLTIVGQTTDYTGAWYDYSILDFGIEFISATGDGKTDTKTVDVSNYSAYSKLAVFVAVNDNNTGVIEINGVTQTVTQSGEVYFCAALIDSAASFAVKIGHGDGGSAMYSVAVYGIINELASTTNYAAYVSSTSANLSIPNAHKAAIVDVMTDRVSGVCVFDGTNMPLTKIGRGYFGDLYHTYLLVVGLNAGTKVLSGPSGVKCFQILALD